MWAKLLGLGFRLSNMTAEQAECLYVYKWLADAAFGPVFCVLPRNQDSVAVAVGIWLLCPILMARPEM